MTTVRDHMTAAPHTIGADQPLARASAQMRELGIRHLPVLHGGEILGVVSERDIALVDALPNVDQARVSVEEAMTPEPYSVSPDAPLAEVARTMAERKYGCAVVMESEKVVGIFTTTDAVALLADLLASKG